MSEVQYKTCRGVISGKSLLRRAEGKERERESIMELIQSKLNLNRTHQNACHL